MGFLFEYIKQPPVVGEVIGGLLLGPSVLSSWFPQAIHFLLPPEIDGQQYYEMLFWGGGHVLQFTFTLLMLVSAFAGYEHIMGLYRHAIAKQYRFFSYGDAMLLNRVPHE